VKILTSDRPVKLKAVRLGSVAVKSQYSTPGEGVQVTLTMPPFASAVKPDGGSAGDPLSLHPLNENVITTADKIQNNLFTIEFLEGYLLRGSVDELAKWLDQRLDYTNSIQYTSSYMWSDSR